VDRWTKANLSASSRAPAWIRQLVLAADQFIVSRPLPDDPEAHSVIAGYHWFGDWGRDTMIALPGLTLSTGRPEIARCILRTFSRFVDRRMLPHRFPDAREAPEYNAVVTMRQCARALGKHADEYESLARRARTGFQRFWNQTGGCCFDVIDGPDGNDASLRPNQLFAVSLPESPLTPEQQRVVVDACARHLLTSYGLRSLSADDPRYRGHYGGGPRERDAAYHQGTAWGWLLGPFVLAHLRVYSDPLLAASFLEPMASHLKVHGLGTGSEIFDGDAPFAPR